MPSRTPEPRFLEPLLGIAFDLDGTLVLSHHDFGRLRAEVVHCAERHGVLPGKLSVQDPVHRIVEKARDEFKNQGIPDGEYYRFEAEYSRGVDRIEMEALPRTIARPGAAELLTRLREREFRLAILTRSSEAFARAALEQTGLATFFGYLRTRSSPGPAKPSAESLLSLLREMNVPLDRALYVGDHLIDAECATRARVRFYAVLPDPSEGPAASMTSDRFLAAGASAVAHDLTELARQLNVAAPPAAAA